MSFNIAEGLHDHHEDHYHHHHRHSTSHEVPCDEKDKHRDRRREDLSILIRKAVREERKRDKFRERKRCVCEREREREEGLRGRTSPPIPRPHSPELTHPLPSSTYPPHPKPTEKAELPGRLRPPRRLRRRFDGVFAHHARVPRLGRGALPGQRKGSGRPRRPPRPRTMERNGDDNESRSGLEED